MRRRQLWGRRRVEDSAWPVKRVLCRRGAGAARRRLTLLLCANKASQRRTLTLELFVNSTTEGIIATTVLYYGGCLGPACTRKGAATVNVFDVAVLLGGPRSLLLHEVGIAS